MKNDMKRYEDQALYELMLWKRKMSNKPSLANKASKAIQVKMSKLVPEKGHEIITDTIKNMVKAVLFGSQIITDTPLISAPLEERERLVAEKIKFYKRTAAFSGAGTGAGGIFLGLADFPILMSIKIKFLFDVATIFGFDTRDYKERLYILYIFLLAFSCQQCRNKVFMKVSNWDEDATVLPTDMEAFNWREFQQEYRDYIDFAKMLQLLPGIGAVVGAYANYNLLKELGYTAMNAYRLRILER